MIRRALSLPDYPPPEAVTPTPRYATIERDVRLWRIHPSGRPGTEFSRNGDGPVVWNGRFDATDEDDYPFMYLAGTIRAALVETALRLDVPFPISGIRSVSRARLNDRAASEIVMKRPITVISLMTSEDLAAARQDHWLIQADRSEFPQTRQWARWLRTADPRAQGLTWPSRRDLGTQLFLLFGDRISQDSIGLRSAAMLLAEEASIACINEVVKPLGITITNT